MAAGDSRNGQPWPALAGGGGGGKELGQAGDGKYENVPSDGTMDRATVDMAKAIDKCLLFGDRRKGHLVSETKEAPMSPHGGGAASSFCPGQGSSTLVSLSPPSSPSSQQQKFLHGSNGGGESSSMLKKLEGTPTFLSSLDGPLFVEEGLVDSLGTDSAVEGKTENDEDVRFQELLQTGSSMEALLASRFRAPMAPLPSALQTGRGFPARGGDAMCLHRQTQKTLEDINTAENETGGNFHQQEELSPLKSLQQQQQQQQQGASAPNSRSPMQHFHIPENFRTPDKLHRKRAKVLPFFTRRGPMVVSTRGSSTSQTHASIQVGSMSDALDKGWPPSVTPASPPPIPHDDGQDPMDSDNDDEDNQQDNDVIEMDANEARMDLTDDLLHKVFSFLDDTTLCQAAMVCRQWRMASVHEDFWKSLNFEGRKVSPDQVALLCVRYPKATQLNLNGAPCVDETLVQQAMRSLRNLEVLTLGKGILSDGFFHVLMECISLRKLSITDAILGSGSAQEIQLQHGSLHCLQIMKCRVLRIAIRCPQLQTLSLKRTGTASAILQCPRLINLDISACNKLSDAGVRAAATACPLLASLDMSNCAYVSDETLREISLVCAGLRSLDASHCPNISLEGVRMPMLTDLKLHGCEGINSSSMAALAHCVMLEVLAMELCWLLTAVTLDLPHLRSISLSNNHKFVELTLRSPSLMAINLTSCPALSRIDITSSSLELMNSVGSHGSSSLPFVMKVMVCHFVSDSHEKLLLRQQTGLVSMALQCPWLQEVDLTECESLTDSVCNVFSDGGGCPKLNCLTLDNCDGLTSVNLSTSSLSTLSLVGCRNISSLSLSCPILQRLQLEGCDRLMDATFTPVGLVSLNLGICPHLTKLEIEAAQMTVLDLRGCGVLSQASICCPRLLSLDASYCSKLGDDCLAATAAACPAIQSLVLATCHAVGPPGLLSLKKLCDLTMLDLSYTFLIDLSPIFEACPHLKVLRLSACKYLSETALDALHGGKVLSELRELDMSYGSLGRAAIEGVLALCPHLTQVSLNGCAHVTDYLWSHLACPPIPLVLGTSEDMGMEDVIDQQSPMDITSPGSILSSEMMQEITCDENLGTEEMKEGVWSLSSTDDSISPESKCSLFNQAVNSSEDPMLGLHTQSPAGALQVSPEIGDNANQILFPMLVGEIAESVRALQILSCVGCPNIQTVKIPRDAACLFLSSLNLSLSNNIREVRLGCINLTYLNLSQCAALVILELECPRLITLCLQACGVEAEMLEHAVLGCSLLETLDVRSCLKVSSAALTRIRAVCPGLKRLYSTSSS